MDHIILERLPDEQVNCIRDFMEEKRRDPKFQGTCVNPILREDILDLLDQYCTVVFYPVADEGNNGFHVRYPEGDIVYINTDQAKEKQIFTAAHELCHIWELEKYVQAKLGLTLDHHQQEQVINRGAAELLMPRQQCLPFIRRRLQELPHKADTMKVTDLLRLCASVMNEYFVPYKSVVLRLYELGFMPKESAQLLLGERPEVVRFQVIEAFLKNVAHEEGYGRLFQRPDRRKRIDGLAELLDKAEADGSMPSRRIAAIRDRFDLNVQPPDRALSELISVEREKGEGQDAQTGGD